MGYKEVFFMAMAVVAFSAINSICLYVAFIRVADHHAAYSHLMTDPIWFTNGYRPPFCGATKVRQTISGKSVQEE